MDLFDSGLKSFNKGVLINCKYDDNTGLMQFYRFDNLVLNDLPVKVEGFKTHFILKGLELTCCFEHKDYPFKETEPFDRGSINYLPYSFNELDITNFQDGSRFFLLKKAVKTSLCSSFEYNPKRCKTLVFELNNLDQFSWGLYEVLELSSVPRDAVLGLQAGVFSKLGLDDTQIVKNFPYLEMEAGEYEPSRSEIIIRLHNKGLADEEIEDLLFDKGPPN